MKGSEEHLLLCERRTETQQNPFPVTVRWQELNGVATLRCTGGWKVSLAEACEPCQDAGGFIPGGGGENGRQGGLQLYREALQLWILPAPHLLLQTRLLSPLLAAGQPARSPRAFAPPAPSALEALVSSLHLSYSPGRPALPDRYPLHPLPWTSSP